MITRENKLAIEVMFHEQHLSAHEISASDEWETPISVDDVLEVLGEKPERQMNTFLTYQGVTMTITQWATVMDIDRHTIRERLKRGWSVNEALTTRPKKMKRRPHELERHRPL